MQGAMPEEKVTSCAGEGSVYSSATLFVQLNQGEINYRDKHEDWGTQKNI
jgi:hypothetical protein